ncbi:MAG TPA: glutaminyl-peptide cyclotransferase [Bacteroidia bacterium]|jgi:glutamine cyclotransferase
MQKKYFYLLICSVLLAACGTEPANIETTGNKAPKPDPVPELSYTVKAKFPHDTLAFTEGFLFHEGLLFESTGSPDNLPQMKSFIGTVDLETGRINKKVELDKQYFGEGISILNGKLYQLTYKGHIGFVYDLKNFRQLMRFNVESEEGWGMTTDGKNLIMSDGTNFLTYLDPVTLKPIKKLAVSNAGYAEDNLNELEYINGFIYANIWTKDYIVKIDTASGKVVGLLNLSGITDEAKRNYRNAEVLNGIAYDPASDKILVTGKMWKNIYQVEFSH